MSDRVGTPAIDFLESRAGMLAKTQASTRREDVASLVPQADGIVKDAQDELAQDQKLANDAQAKYLKKFSPFSMSRESRAFKIEIVTPAQQHLHAAQLALSHAQAVRDSVKQEAQPVEVRRQFSSGICGIYNEASGKVEWKSQIDGGVAGAYDSATKQVQWASQIDGGAAIVRLQNGTLVPKTQIGMGIAGYVDPQTHDAKFITDFASGVAAIVDDKGVLHKESHFQSGVAGYIDPADGQAKFTDPSFHEGVAVIYRYGDTYRSSCGYAPSDEN